MRMKKCGQDATTAASSTEPPSPTIVIAGAGIVGLVLALALKKHAGITAELYEQARSFQDGAGAGIGLYPNGMRVIRDISPEILERIQKCGYPYLFRRWERHDGTEVVFAEETVLGRSENTNVENGTIAEGINGDISLLQPLGIRRWKLQKILFDAVQKMGIPVFFFKKITSIDKKTNSREINLHFADGTVKVADMVLAADGAKSPIRTAIAGHLTKLTYTGTTCLYGTASVAREARGICFPSSDTTRCHGCFYPIGPNEQCFQFHIPTENPNAADDGGWRALLEDVGKAECHALASRLKTDGWDEKYLKPLYHADKAIKVPVAVLHPHLPRFVFGRVVLVGDAAHPPVPYLGQGAQQGLEDAGTLAILFREATTGGETASLPSTTIGGTASFLSRMDVLLQVYDKLRVSRTAAMVKSSQQMGDMQQKRAENARYNKVKEELIRRDVFFHETMPTILPGVSYDYKKELLEALEEKPLNLLPVPEEE